VILREGVRRALVAVGTLLWIGAGFMPALGGGAKHAYRCRDREFSGAFDDCFNDYIPVAEVFAILIALVTAYLFFRFARSLFMTSEPHPRGGYVVRTILDATGNIAVLGALWSLWRFSTYPGVVQMLPYLVFWLVFSLWFTIGAMVNRAGEQGSDL
jgi:hypothetical protein